MKRFFSEYKFTTGLLFLAIFIVISYILTDNLPELFPYGDALFKLLSDLSLAYMASFIFFILVQYLPETKKRQKYQEIALRQLRIPLYVHARLFLYVYKSSVTEITNSNLDALEDLFNDSFYKEIRAFDVTKQAPLDSQKTWIEYIGQECLRFSNSLEKITDKYTYYLDSNIIEAIEELRNSHFMRFFLGEAEIRVYTIENCWVHIDNVLDSYKGKNVSIFNASGELDIVKEHIEYFLSLVKIYNDTHQSKPIVVDNQLWKDSIAPKAGSAIGNI
ncbi:MAG: hypothetical protein PHV53_11360 [Fermentimonas sp.]|nr:hypothetical protein [Fermentimonas sp.]